MLKEQSEVYAKLIFAIRNVSKIQSLKKKHTSAELYLPYFLP